MEKDDHTLEHFAKEVCRECNQNLIRIAGNLYTLHNAVTCVKRELKTESHFEMCFIEQSSSSSEQQKECIGIRATDLGAKNGEEIQVKMEIDAEFHFEESQNQPDCLINPTTNKTYQTPDEVIGGQSDDNRMSPADNGWFDNDSSRDSNCFEDSTINTKSIGQLESKNISVDVSVASPYIQPNEAIGFSDKKFNLTNESCSKQTNLNENSLIKPENFEIFHRKSPDQTKTEPNFCENCWSTFLTAEELNEHTLECVIRKKGEPIECDICKKSLSSMRTLKQHKLLRHTPTGTHVCRRCSRVFTTEKQLETHRPGCIQKWKNRFEINKILDTNATFECYLCKTHSKSISSLSAHMRWKHDLNNIKFKCNICGMGFFTKFLQDMHLKRHNEPLNDRKFMCNVCGKFFTKGYTLKDHMKIHSGDKPFKCTHEGCSKTFHAKTARVIHMRSHNPEDRLKCPHDGCPKSFLSKPSLTIHLRSHSGEKPFKCPHEGCNKSFLTKNIITSHMLIHTGEKPFKCTQYGCRKEFRTKGARDRHLGTNAHK